jgi:transposase
MGDLSDFERGEIIGARLARESVTKITTLLAASIATVSKAISAYTSHGKTTSAKWNSGRKSALAGDVVHCAGLL